MNDFDFLGILDVLLRRRVRFVVIGGVAANLHGSTTITRDLDICYARDDDNLERLAEALKDINARLRGKNVPEDLPFMLDPETLRMGDHFTFQTDLGKLDLLGTPKGVGGFESLERGAVEMTVEGKRLLAASIDDLIKMKRAAGRTKDLIEIENLGALRDLVDEEGPGRTE